MNCADCGVGLPIDQRIAVDGEIICGHCFIKRPTKVKAEKEIVEQLGVDSVEQFMEVIVALDDRLSALEQDVQKMKQYIEDLNI